MPTIFQACYGPVPHLRSAALIEGDAQRPRQPDQTVQLEDHATRTPQALRDLIGANAACDSIDRTVEWSEEDIVLLHWGLLRELRRLADPDTPLEEKLDTLAWALTDPALDDRPFSMATCIRVVGTSPLSPTPYFGVTSVDDIRDWIRANAPRWLRATLARYPEWVRQLVRSQPDWICRELSRNPQWINEQVKRRDSSRQPDLFGDQSMLLAY